VTVTNADGKQVGRPLPIDKQESISRYFDDLAAKASPTAAAKRTKPLQHRTGQSASVAPVVRPLALPWAARADELLRAGETDDAQRSSAGQRIMSRPDNE
jgi:hypothetical protein